MEHADADPFKRLLLMPALFKGFEASLCFHSATYSIALTRSLWAFPLQALLGVDGSTVSAAVKKLCNEDPAVRSVEFEGRQEVLTGAHLRSLALEAEGMASTARVTMTELSLRFGLPVDVSACREKNSRSPLPLTVHESPCRTAGISAPCSDGDNAPSLSTRVVQ